MLTRKQFFGEVRWNSEIERLVQDGKRPAIPSDCPRIYESLVQHCWSSDSSQRPTFSQILVVLSKLSSSLGLEEDPSSLKARQQEEKKQLTFSSEESSTPQTPGSRPFPDSKVGALSEESEDTMSSDNSMQMKRLLGGSGESASVYEYAMTLHQEGQIQCMVHFKIGDVESIWTGDNDGFIHVFNLLSQKLLHRFRAHNIGVLCMMLTSKNQVWTSSRDGSIKIWSWSSSGAEPACIKTVRKPSKQGKAVTCMTCEHDVVLCGNSSGQIVGFREPRQKKSILAQTDSSISCIMVSNGLIWVGVGDTVFCTSGEDPPKVFRKKRKPDFVLIFLFFLFFFFFFFFFYFFFFFFDCLQSFLLRCHKGPVHQLLKVGQYVWSVSSDKTCVVWGVKNGTPRCLEVLEGHASRIFAAATDGSKFVWTGGWDKTIISWSFATHKFISSMEAKHDDAIAVLLWIGCCGDLRDKFLVSGSWDGKIVLWKDAVAAKKPQLDVKVSKSVSDHWGPGGASEQRPQSASGFENFGKGLKLLSRSPSKGLLPTASSPQESPRSVMSRLTRKTSRSTLPEVNPAQNTDSSNVSRRGSFIKNGSGSSSETVVQKKTE